MNSIDRKIKNVDDAICEFIELIGVSSRGRMSDAILKHLRDLVEHIAVKIYDEKENVKIDYEGIPAALNYLKTSNEYYFIRKFHFFLQQSTSHYTHDIDGAERLMLKYYEYMIQLKNYVFHKFGMEILNNIDKFPTDIDDTLRPYYEKIVEKIDKPQFGRNTQMTNERFRVLKTKAFFVDGKVYYETTLILANDSSSKFNRIVVFSNFKIYTEYAVKISIHEEIIDVSGKLMPIKILTSWITSIRPCELNNFSDILGMSITTKSSHAEYIGLMNYLTQTGLNLVDVLEFDDERYEEFKRKITSNAKTVLLCDVFDKARKWIVSTRDGSNVIRYLLCFLNNKVIKLQSFKYKSYFMKDLYLHGKSYPFDKMPINFSLRGHNPSLSDLLLCINTENRDDEILARFIEMNSDTYGKLYCKEECIEGFDDKEKLIEKYNSKLDYAGHQFKRIEKIGTNYYVKGNEESTKSIIEFLLKLSKEEVIDYKSFVERWLEEYPNIIDCDEKKEILLSMFSKSKVAMIYGAAGTGKSTLIRHISQLWNGCNKVYVANTHPAVENMRRKVNDSSGEYLTIKKYINSYNMNNKIDILFVDECSMVSNEDMVKIIKKGNFDLLVLVGDIYQIESIKFGNWFNIARYFVPQRSQFELIKPYRTNDDNLLELWKRVRNYQDDITEWLVYGAFNCQIDESIFEPVASDEIILCLNYDGLYGINNLNRFLQNANPNKSIRLGIWTYKVGDPILFNESTRYEAVLYNNLKGKIVNIEEINDEIYFTVEVDRVINSVQITGTDLELLPMINESKSVVRFSVKKKQEGDDDFDDNDLESNIPFQIAYAVSIHKAQGLEYESVKLIITKEIDELISHNIFYTAITRAKKCLKIYWSPDSQEKILSSFDSDETLYDAKIFSAKTGLKLINKKHIISK